MGKKERWSHTQGMLRTNWKKEHPDKVITSIKVNKAQIRRIESNRGGKFGRGDLKPYTVTYRKRKPKKKRKKKK